MVEQNPQLASEDPERTQRPSGVIGSVWSKARKLVMTVGARGAQCGRSEPDSRPTVAEIVEKNPRLASEAPEHSQRPFGVIGAVGSKSSFGLGESEPSKLISGHVDVKITLYKKKFMAERIQNRFLINLCQRSSSTDISYSTFRNSEILDS